MLLRDYSKLDKFINSIPPQEEFYTKGSGPYAESYEKLTNDGISEVRERFRSKDYSGLRVLDVGVGSGYASKLFTDLGAVVSGITINESDVKENVVLMDMSFLEYPDKTFNLVWARHCLEHSLFPYFTLSELHRVLQYKGIIYIEVPAPEGGHEQCENHYSVMGKKMWLSLMERVGFREIDFKEIDVMGKDTYYRFIGRRVLN